MRGFFIFNATKLSIHIHLHIINFHNHPFNFFQFVNRKSKIKN